MDINSIEDRRNNLDALCLERVATYLSTNGTIAITVFGAYTTVMAVLTSFAFTEHSPKNIILGPVICTFSLLILPVCGTLYKWINEQLLYVSKFGAIQSYIENRISYEELYEVVAVEFRATGKRSDVMRLFCKQLLSIFIPTGNIYSVYFFVYIFFPHGTMHLIDSPAFNHLTAFGVPQILSEPLIVHLFLFFVQLLTLFVSLHSNYKFNIGAQSYFNNVDGNASIASQENQSITILRRFRNWACSLHN